MDVQFSAGDIVRVSDGFVSEVIATWGDFVWLKAGRPVVVNEGDCEFVARPSREPVDAH